MRRILIFILTIALLSCKKDDIGVFNADPADVIITFESFAGGAYMNYELPNNSDIYAIQAKYNNHSGQQVTVKGTYLSNQVSLFGFVNEESEVPVEIRLIDLNDNYSKSITKYFSTEKCAANSFFDNLEVSKYWNGFKIKYTGPEKSDGFFHIGHVAMNPTTNELDTLLIETLPIVRREQTHLYSDLADPETNKTTVVIWTEDFKGNKVRREVFKDIPAAIAEKMNTENVSFTGSSREDATLKVGWQYLFDGDTKGTRAYEASNGNDYFFMSKTDAVPGYWTIDLKESKNLAFLKFYSPLNTDRPLQFQTYPWWGALPSHIKVYGSNDNNLPIEEWVELGEKYQPASIPEQDMWVWRSLDVTEKYESLEDLQNAEPNFTQVNFNVTEDNYRYIRLQILETFVIMRYGSEVWSGNRFMLQELEVFVSKPNN